MPVKKEAWTPTWSDEFDGPDGSAPDPSKWTVEVSSTSPPNEELQCYTDGADNISVRGGELVITAKREDYRCPDGQLRQYTSGRMNSLGKFAQKYGRFEARVRVPSGKGFWPAFWMMGNDIEKVDWPACGEIDVMEQIGREPTKIFGTIHGPNYWGEKGPSTVLDLGAPVAAGYHVFAVEWEPERIRFFVDGRLYSARTPADIPKGERWVFDHPFFIIVNLAVGGGLPGSPDAQTRFPQEYRVDYVRAFSRR